VRIYQLVLAMPLVPLFCSTTEPSVTQASEGRPFNVHDLVSLDRASQPALSPDARHVVFVLRSTDLDANKGRTDLWLMRSDGTGLKRLTTHPANDWAPQWLDNRTVAFLSTRSESAQVWSIGIDGGEAVQITRLPVDLDNLRVSRDGRLLGFSAETWPDCDNLECTAKRDEEKKKNKASGMVFDSLFVRHWDTWANGKRNHIFVMPVAGGDAVDIMKKLDADSPTRPWGGIEDYDFSPDGKRIAFSMKKPMGSAEAWSTNEDIWLAPTDGSAAPVDITEQNLARDSQPVFSPDGNTIAYLAMSSPGYEADRYRVVLHDIASGEKKVLTEGWDRSPASLAYSRKGDKLWVTADNLGQVSIFSIDARSGKEKLVVRDGTNQAPMETDRGLLFLRDSLTAPADFWLSSTGGGNEKRVTELNRDRLKGVGLGQPEQFTFQGAKGDIVHAYVVKPVGFDPSKRYPLAFLVHGGPQGSFGNHFHYRWNPQTYAGAGYAAVMVDFHGSTGYGQAFTDAIRDDWGGAPFEDLMKGLDAAIQRYPWIDGDRACALGASYGGYMINWIAGHTDRFKCLVVHDGNIDERMAYFDTEELWFPEWEHKGTPWENPEGYRKHNPVEFVKEWKTPTLVIHGGLDFRVVDTQGLSTFTVLQRKGIPSKLLYFPDENHWVLKPANSILWHDTVNGWLDQWLRPEASRK